MAISREFTTMTDDETGFFGWMPRGMAGANTSTGPGVAHDVMEHICGGPTAVTDEIMAIGVQWWLRYETGWRNRFVLRQLDPQALGDQIGFTLRDCFEGDSGWPIPDCGPSRAVSDWIDEPMRFACKTGVELAIAETSLGCTDQHAAEIEAEFRSTDIEGICLSWLRRGYRMARRRYRLMDPFTGAVLYDRIGEACQKILDKAREEEGIEMKVSVSPKRCMARIDCWRAGPEPILIAA